MTHNEHERARELIALGGLEEAQQNWLGGHLRECVACREYADAAGQMVRAVRSLPVTADARLVRATQMRVRFHAARLREARARMWLVGTACLGVGLSATITIPLAWRLFAWMGHSARVSSLVWETGFAVFWIVPALVVSALLMARGTHLADGGRSIGD
jgi:predicted anti-sigma-YlaC factor YlaD